jgi:hypothetical protein
VAGMLDWWWCYWGHFVTSREMSAVQAVPLICRLGVWKHFVAARYKRRYVHVYQKSCIANTSSIVRLGRRRVLILVTNTSTLPVKEMLLILN